MANPLYDGLDWFYNTQTGEIHHIKGGTVTGFLLWQWYASQGYFVRVKTKENAEKYKKEFPPKRGPGVDIPVVGSAVAEGTGNVTGAVPSVSSPVNSALASVYNMGIQAAVLIGAGILIVLGAVILLRSPLNKAASTTAKVAGAVK